MKTRITTRMTMPTTRAVQAPLRRVWRSPGSAGPVSVSWPVGSLTSGGNRKRRALEFGATQKTPVRRPDYGHQRDECAGKRASTPRLSRLAAHSMNQRPVPVSPEPRRNLELTGHRRLCSAAGDSLRRPFDSDAGCRPSGFRGELNRRTQAPGGDAGSRNLAGPGNDRLRRKAKSGLAASAAERAPRAIAAWSPSQIQLPAQLARWLGAGELRRDTAGVRRPMHADQPGRAASCATPCRELPPLQPVGGDGRDRRSYEPPTLPAVHGASRSRPRQPWSAALRLQPAATWSSPTGR